MSKLIEIHVPDIGDYSDVPVIEVLVKVGDVIVRIDSHYYRPTEVDTLLGDPTKARIQLGWVPEISIEQMIAEMVAHDLGIAKQMALLRQHGYSVSVGKEK